MGRLPKKWFAAALMACAVQAVPAYAQWMGGRMDTNLYIGGTIGQARFKGACDGVPVSVSCDDKDTAGKAFIGWQFNRNLAIEAAYFHLGEATASGPLAGGTVSAEARVRGVDLVAIAIIPVWQQLSLYGKVGVARSRVNVTGTAAIAGTVFGLGSMKENSTDLTYGLGAQYGLTQNLAIRLEWQRFDSVGGGTLDKHDIDLFSGGIVWRF